MIPKPLLYTLPLASPSPTNQPLVGGVGMDIGIGSDKGRRIIGIDAFRNCRLIKGIRTGE